MAKIKKIDLKAVQNKNRVNFHRRWKSILKNEQQNQNNSQNQNSERHDSNQEHHENETTSSNDRLRRRAMKYNISKRAISDLLTILISFGMTWLPKDSRSLLATPRKIELINLTNGKLWYDLHDVDAIA